MTETLPSVNEVLKRIQADLAAVRYLPTPRYYRCATGTLAVYTPRSTEPGEDYVLHRFEGLLRDDSGKIVRKYYLRRDEHGRFGRAYYATRPKLA
jgi:hypothetical protein